jgi:hypothetical protein
MNTFQTHLFEIYRFAYLLKAAFLMIQMYCTVPVSVWIAWTQIAFDTLCV